MDKANISQELKDISDILTKAKIRLAKVIPGLVDTNIAYYQLSDITMALSSLSRYSSNLIEVAEVLDKLQDPPKRNK